MDEDRRRIATEVWQAELSPEDQALLSSVLEDLADDPFLRAVAARSIEAMAITPGCHVLDVGCGTGVLLPALAALVGPGGKVVGLDHSRPLLDRARERVEAAGLGGVVELIEGDAAALPLPDGAFDAVHIERVLMHLEDPDAAIREMRRVARPGGRIVAAEPDSNAVRVDHPLDPEAYALIMAQDALQFRNPDIGLELHRRFGRAGIVDRSVVPMTAFEGAYDGIGAEGDRIAARELIASGVLSTERAEAAIAYLSDASARGEFAWFATMVIEIGRAPGAEQVPGT